MKCFVIAMENEAEPIIRAMKAERNIVFCGKRILTGRLFGQKVGIVVCGVGKVNAACGTQIAVDELGAEEIINVGVAGVTVPLKSEKFTKFRTRCSTIST